MSIGFFFTCISLKFNYKGLAPMKMYFLLILFSVFAFMSSCINISRTHVFQFGVLDLRNAELDANIFYSLDGDWEFYWEQFLDANNPKLEDGAEKKYMKIPGIWNGLEVDGKELSGKGYATLRATILTRPTNVILGFKLPVLSLPYTLFINGEKVCSNGVPSSIKEKSSTDFTSDICIYSHSGEKLEMVLLIANFYNKSGGILNSIVWGNVKKIEEVHSQFMIPAFIFFGVAIFICLYQLEIYFFRRKDVTALYFGLICFLLAIRIFVSGEKYIIKIFPHLSWEWLIQLEYLNVYLLLPAFAFYQYSIFPFEFQKLALKIINLFAFVVIAIVILAPAYTASYTIEIFELFVISSSIYSFYVIIKAMQNGRNEALHFFLSFSPLFLGVVNDILYYNFNLSSFLFTPILWILFLFLQSILLSRKFSQAVSKVESLSTDMNNMNKSFKRFVPAEFLAILGKKRLIDVKLGDQVKQEMTIMFVDIRSFTTITEKMKPEESFNFINNYLSRIGPIIRQNKGFIDKYIGDGIMALFPSNPDDAILSAIQMLEEVKKINAENPDAYPIKIGIGIHTGDLMLGIVGENERIEGTVIADAVNLAARLEGLTKVYGSSILISHQTFYNLDDSEKYDFRILDKVKVKGKNESVTVIEILNGRQPTHVQLILSAKLEFERGVAAYLMKDFARAEKIFREILEQNPDDIAMKLYLERAHHYAKHGVPLDWEGIEAM